MLEANALAIHLNPLQEAVQPEGDTNFSGVIRKIGEISQAVDVPVIVKETGSGIAAEVANLLEKAGVVGIEVSGVGGTNWALVEYFRAKREQDKLHQRLGETFRSWGISTAASIVETAQSVDLTVIASGGIRSGLDIAKSLALGAHLSSIALPILHSAIKGSTEVKKTLNLLIEEMKTAMFIVGAESIEKLQQVPVVLKGETSEWLRLRGFSPEFYARRKRLNKVNICGE
jgi:isopentenyl-diphosphate delta-isomerase